jgi:hypothetical protein
VPIADWAALAFFLVALAAGTVWVAVNAVQAWRRTRQVPRRMLGRIDELAVSATVLERRAAGLSAGSDVLQRNVAHLAVSLARLRVIVAATQDVRATVARVRMFLPSK